MEPLDRRRLNRKCSGSRACNLLLLCVFLPRDRRNQQIPLDDLHLLANRQCDKLVARAPGSQCGTAKSH